MDTVTDAVGVMDADGVTDAEGVMVRVELTLDEPVMETDGVKIELGIVVLEGEELIETDPDWVLVTTVDTDCDDDKEGTGVTLSASSELGVTEKDLLGVGDLVIEGDMVTDSEMLTEIDALFDAVRDVVGVADHDEEEVEDKDDPLDGVMLGVRLLAGVTDIVFVLVGLLVTLGTGVTDIDGVRDFEPARHGIPQTEHGGKLKTIIHQAP